MKLILYLVILTSIATSNSYVYNNFKDALLLKRSYDPKPRFEIKSNKREFKNEKSNRIGQVDLLQKAKKLKEDSMKQYRHTREDDTKKINRAIYQLDPVLNFLRRTEYRRRKDSFSSDASSSSLELKQWKDEWKEQWIKKKFEAVNSTDLKKDVVNMVAAKPWGVPCGDPGQHDMPWGTCMLPMECESEYRIYRGDYFCGRTQFICCALQLSNYDMYQGFDVSFDDSALSTDSEEKNRGKGSKERSGKKKKREKRRKRRERLRRKRKIKKNIKKIIREIRKILNRAYKNGTTARKKKTKQLKKFINDMKKRYKKDRQSVKDVHEEELIKIDTALQNRLNQIKDVNQEFLKNSTFRDMVMSGMISKKGARMLLEAYPDLATYFGDKTRRTIGDQNHLDYDVEYGLLYY